MTKVVDSKLVATSITPSPQAIPPQVIDAVQGNKSLLEKIISLLEVKEAKSAPALDVNENEDITLDAPPGCASKSDQESGQWWIVLIPKWWNVISSNLPN